VPGRAARAVGAGARGGGGDAPHRLGRLVDGGGDPGDRGAVCGVRCGQAVATAGAADPVRGLCAVAAGVAAGRGSGEPSWVLEGAAGGGACGTGPADRPGASDGAELSGCGSTVLLLA